MFELLKSKHPIAHPPTCNHLTHFPNLHSISIDANLKEQCVVYWVDESSI